MIYIEMLKAYRWWQMQRNDDRWAKTDWSYQL